MTSVFRKGKFDSICMYVVKLRWDTLSFRRPDIEFLTSCGEKNGIQHFRDRNNKTAINMVCRLVCIMQKHYWQKRIF